MGTLPGNVITGVLKLSVSTADGREQIVGVVFPSDFIGRPFGKESPYGITALTEAEVCIFTRSAFDSFAKDHPNLQHKLLQRTLDELDRARQWMMLLGRKTASERIATLLIEVSNRLGATGCSAIEPFLDRFELPMEGPPFIREQVLMRMVLLLAAKWRVWTLDFCLI
jgi:CRP/FNR family transcriptional regulator